MIYIVIGLLHPHNGYISLYTGERGRGGGGGGGGGSYELPLESPNTTRPKIPQIYCLQMVSLEARGSEPHALA